MQDRTIFGGVIEIWYDPIHHRVQVYTYGADIAVTFNNGDQFGARATADGKVDVYRNGGLLASRDISAWPYAAGGGSIGLWFIGASHMLLDNFGGGQARLVSHQESFEGAVDACCLRRPSAFTRGAD